MRPVTQRLTPTVKALVIANTVVTLLYVFAEPARGALLDVVALGPSFFRGFVWQPLSSSFLHLDALGFAFGLLGLWFVGASLEAMWGRRRFLLLYFGAGCSGALAHVVTAFLFDAPALVSGGGLSVLALFVAFGVHHGRTRVRVFGQLEMEARALSAILVGLSVFAELLSGAFFALVGTLVAVLAAYLIAGGRPGDIQRALKRGVQALLGRRVKGKRRDRMVVLDGGKSSRDRSDWLN